MYAGSLGNWWISSSHREGSAAGLTGRRYTCIIRCQEVNHLYLWAAGAASLGAAARIGLWICDLWTQRYLRTRFAEVEQLTGRESLFDADVCRVAEAAV